MMSDNKDKDYPGIELLRFLSALAVLVWHYQHYTYGPSGFSIERDQQPFYEFVYLFYSYGVYGVQLFWCISGFVFFHVYSENIRKRNIGFSVFWIRRLARLYPLHIFTLVMVLFFQFIFNLKNGYFFVYPYNDVKHFVLNLFMASHWGMQDGYSFNGPIWSVSIEILIYVFFFFWAFVNRLPIRVILLAVLTLIFYFFQQTEVLECLFLFFGGGVVYRIINCEVFSIRCFLFIFLIFTNGITLYNIVDAGGIYAVSTEYRTIQIILLCLVLICVAAIIRVDGFKRRLFFGLGNLTYSIYLMHFPLQLGMVLLFYMIDLKLDYHSNWLFVFYMIGTISLSMVTYKYIELPARKKIREYSQ
jgi:peptidoglycan/LPS O-acetylase OafA/YrhL